MPPKTLAPLLLAALALPAFAQTAEEPKPANEQVIVPQVERRAVKLPRLPSNDIELGLYTGWYAAQNFGTSTVTGVRLGYHLTEDLFVQGVYGRTKVSDEELRSVLGASVLKTGNGRLKYYNVSAGYNLLPGEVFIGKGIAKASSFYLIGGIGSTNFDGRSRQTFNFGLGGRVLMADWAAVQFDVRDHVFKLDLLSSNKTTHNLEVTGGLSFFF